MERITRFYKKLIFSLGKPLLKIVDFFAPRYFMKMFIILLRFCGVKFTGLPRYISTKVKFDDFEMVTIGERVVISENVILLTHDYSVTTALIANNEMPDTDIAFVRGIDIGDNVFVGMNALLLPGVKIGNNVIIAAGSVVRGSIPDNTIWVGNPATCIGTLTDKVDKWKKMLILTNKRVDKK